MLKKVPTPQVQLGMFLQSMEGSWLAHPFWKTKFVLREQADLDALLASGVPAVWIDSQRGLDFPVVPIAVQVERPMEATLMAAVALDHSAAQVPPKPPPAPSPPSSSVSMAEEMDRAAQMVNRSRQAVTALFGEARMGRAVDVEQCLPLVDELSQSIARNPSALISLARLKTKDDYTYMHSVAVCALMISLSRQLGLSPEQTQIAGFAGLLHDIGKMTTPLDILNKPGALSDAEFGVVRLHPERGYQVLKENGGMVPDEVLDVCLHHHEKIDGSGYPGKLKGEQISLMARMGAVCDVYDAITSTRPYKSAWDPAGSIQRMAQWTGQFDPAIFQAFVKCVGIYPVGTLVKLRSGRLAVVLEQNQANLVAPWVKVFFSSHSESSIPMLTLDLSRSDANDRITGRELASDWGFTNLDELWRKQS